MPLVLLTFAGSQAWKKEQGEKAPLLGGVWGSRSQRPTRDFNPGPISTRCPSPHFARSDPSLPAPAPARSPRVARPDHAAPLAPHRRASFSAKRCSAREPQSGGRGPRGRPARSRGGGRGGGSGAGGGVGEGIAGGEESVLRKPQKKGGRVHRRKPKVYIWLTQL